MPTNTPAVIVSVAILASVGVAQAQLFGSGGGTRRDAVPQQPDAGAFDPAMCDQLASIPNAPMSADTCRSMIRMQQSMKAGASDPNAVRPGDENLSCEQIYAEMRASGPMISQETAAQSRVAADASLAKTEKQNAEMKAFAAQQMAVGVGAGAVGTLPGGGYAAMAAQQAMMAQQQGFAQKQAQEAAPVRAQQNQAITAVSGELGQALDSNPRYARMMQLVVDKNCPPPPDAPR